MEPYRDEHPRHHRTRSPGGLSHEPPSRPRSSRRAPARPRGGPRRLRLVAGTGRTRRLRPATPSPGGTLTYLEHQTYTNLYPPQAGFYPNGGVVNNITARLTWQNPESLEIEPWIASDWTVNARRDRVHVQPEARTSRFSDGTPLDAAAVAKNFDTYGLGDAERGLTVSEAINNYASSEVVDEDTVTFRFSAPRPGFLQATSTINSGLLSPETLDGTIEDFGAGNAEEIIGSGPFTVTDEKLGTEYTLTARDDYAWAPESAENQGRPYLDAVHVLVTPEDSVRIGSLLAGQADYVRYVQAFDEDRVESAGFTLYAPQTRGVNNSISLRPEQPAAHRHPRPPGAGGRRRRAGGRRHAVHRELPGRDVGALLRGARLQGRVGALRATTPTRPRSCSTRPAGSPVPTASARRTASGCRSPSTRPSPQPLSKQTLELVAQQLAKVGVELTVKPGDAGSYAEDTRDPVEDRLLPLDGRPRGPRRDQEPVLHEEPRRAHLERRRARRAAARRGIRARSPTSASRPRRPCRTTSPSRRT